MLRASSMRHGSGSSSMSSSSNKNDCSPACRTQRPQTARWRRPRLLRLRAPRAVAKRTALQARCPTMGWPHSVITRIGPALPQPTARVQLLRRHTRQLITNAESRLSRHSPWPTRGPNADLTFGSTMRGGGDLGVKEPCKWNCSEGFVAGRRCARLGLSRRRSRVRVPSLPPLDVPANGHLMLPR
jgi:hypothetical protein